MFSAAHSIAFRIQINPCVPCSTATKVDNVTDTPTCHTDSALLMHSTASAYKQITSAMLSSDQVAATHNMTSSLDQHALHYTPMQHYTHPPHCLSQPSYAHNYLIEVIASLVVFLQFFTLDIQCSSEQYLVAIRFSLPHY